ncbi:hypothetical protein PAMP_016044 [Pampus punctatissimus]
MDVAALSIRLLINVLMVVQVPHSYCSQKDDSGEYWCEDGKGLRSNAINISVTAGSVILESPVLPPKQGDSLTLHCKKKHTFDLVIADFYKNGLHVKTGYNENLTIHNISTSNEGLYKCTISGAGESPESWLTVRESHNETTPRPTTPPPTTPLPSSDVVSFKSSVVSVLVSIVALLLLVLGVLCYKKHKRTQEITQRSANRVTGADSVFDPYSVTFVGENQKKEPKPHSPQEIVIYSTVNSRSVRAETPD